MLDSTMESDSKTGFGVRGRITLENEATTCHHSSCPTIQRISIEETAGRWLTAVIKPGYSFLLHREHVLYSQAPPQLPEEK